jgi:hypothetical protein
VIAIAIEAELDLSPGTDPRAPGGAVTVGLCGQWDHEGPCRWPHHSRIDTSVNPARLHVVVATDDGRTGEILNRVETSLARDERWSLRRCAIRRLSTDEQGLGRRLLSSLSRTWCMRRRHRCAAVS